MENCTNLKTPQKETPMEVPMETEPVDPIEITMEIDEVERNRGHISTLGSVKQPSKKMLGE